MSASRSRDTSRITGLRAKPLIIDAVSVMSCTITLEGLDEIELFTALIYWVIMEQVQVCNLVCYEQMYIQATFAPLHFS